MLMFKPLNTEGFADRTKWCGPSLVAMIAGIPLKQAHEKLCMMTGVKNKDELGVWDEEILLLLAEMGYRFKKLDDWNRTLGAYLKQQPVMERASMIIASLPGHVVGLQYGMLFDNAHPKGATKTVWHRRPVCHLYMITRGPA